MHCNVSKTICKLRNLHENSRTYIMFESNVLSDTCNMTHWHNTCPSLRTSKKLSGSPDVFSGNPVTLLTHSKHSCASSSLYLLFIYTI